MVTKINTELQRYQFIFETTFSKLPSQVNEQNQGRRIKRDFWRDHFVLNFMMIYLVFQADVHCRMRPVDYCYLLKPVVGQCYN